MRKLQFFVFVSMLQLLVFVEISGNNSIDQADNMQTESFAAPDTNSIWLQPQQDGPAIPVWGHAEGISVGIAPLPGPRGLLRIYTPYLGINSPTMLNFIAFEPIPKGSVFRGFSELERSKLDNTRGKRFWSQNDSIRGKALDPEYPATGTLSLVNGEQVLTVFIFSEAFENGAYVYVRLRFFESKPHEIELTAYADSQSIELEQFILTATMGNLPRLRKLFLAEEVLSSHELWPDYQGVHFTDHAIFPLERLMKDDCGNAYFISCPNERDATLAEYATGTRNHWKYQGAFATQYWICKNPQSGLTGIVNGRRVYWASVAPIPGGISFENFELKEPFVNGNQYIYGASPESPEDLINAFGLVKK